MELRQWVESRYRHPVVVVLASRTADEAARRNGMDLINMIRPFAVYDGDLFARLTDRADATLVRNFGVRLTRAQCVREVGETTLLHHLRDLLCGQSEVELALGEQLDRALQCLMKKGGGVLTDTRVSAELGSTLLERSHPDWHRQFVQNYVYSVRCSHFDTTDHPVGFIYAASTNASGGVEGILKEFNELKRGQEIGEIWRNMPCMEEEMHSHFLLLHDVTEGPGMDEVNRMFAAVQSSLGHANCALVKLNSISNPQNVKNMDPSVWTDANPSFMDVPSDTACRAVRYSQQLESRSGSPASAGGGGDSASSRVAAEPLLFPRVQAMFGKWPDGTAKVTGCYLSPENVRDLRAVMHHYLSQCLFTFIERKLRSLNTTVNERRTTTLGKMAAWFRNKNEVNKSKTESWVAARGNSRAMYLAGSLEMQMRRAADLSLALADYDAAANFYRLCRAEALATVETRAFNKPLIAAAQEGIGICHFLQGRLLPSSLTPWRAGGTSSKNNSDCRLEVAMNDYDACEMNVYSLRVALLLYEFCRTRTPPLVDRTTALLLHVQHRGMVGRSKLQIAVLQELLAANALFLNPPQCAGMRIKASLPNNFPVHAHVRTYMKYCIAAGDAYCSEDMFQSALRCYLRALFVYGSVGRCGSWPHICEHLFMGLSQLYHQLENPVRAIAMMAVAVLLGTPKYSNPKTALSSLKTFLEKQQEVVGELGIGVCPHMVVPAIVENTVRISVNQYHCDEITTQQQCQLGGEAVETEWQKVEDKLRSHYKDQLTGSPIGTRQWGAELSKFRQSSKRDGSGKKSMRRYTVNQEESLQVSVKLRNPIGSHLTVENMCLLFVSRDEPAKLCRSSESQTIEFAAGASRTITLNFTPQAEGTYVIVGFAWEVMSSLGHYYFATEGASGAASTEGNTSSSNNLGGYVAGMGGGLLLEHAMNNATPEVESPANIEIVVGPPQAWVTMRLEPELPSVLRDGEYFHTFVVVTNNSTHAEAHNVTLQRSATNAQVLWFEDFGLERNIEAEATFNVAQVLHPKESVSISLTVRGQLGHGASPRCRNNIFLLVGYLGGPSTTPGRQDVKATPISPTPSNATVPYVRLHRFVRLIAVKRTIILSSFVLEPVNLASATSALQLTVANVSDTAEQPLRVVRMTAIHRPRWYVAAIHTGALLENDAAGLVVPSGGSFCLPLSVADKATLSRGKAGLGSAVGSDGVADTAPDAQPTAFTEEEYISLTVTLPSPDKCAQVESKISSSVIGSAMSTYFMRTSIRGSGTLGEIAANDGFVFYADKGPDGDQQKVPRVDPVTQVAIGEPFTPICVAVAWMLQDGSGRCGQLFHFVDPVSYLISGGPLSSKAYELQQEELCEALVENRSLHPRQAALLYHVEAPHSVESTKELPDAALIPITVHCRSLSAHVLLVTLKAKTMPAAGIDRSDSPSLLSPTLMTFVGKTSYSFLLLPHQNHAVKFTAYVFQSGLVQCNAFHVSAMALRLCSAGVDTSRWKSGMSEAAMIRSLRYSSSSTTSLRQAESFLGELNSGSNSDITELPASMRCDVQTSVFGYAAAAIARVSLASYSPEAVKAAAAAASARMKEYRDDLKRYEESCKSFEHRRSALSASGRVPNSAHATYHPAARLLCEGAGN
ncbi:ER-golgi trafficking TRAPP I complex 85 kDa subunit, putative [Trypanosoma equiperdum]|uniref:ER-golgi trafficking TRAPP I complex 85 kDa subunit, putative n=1 Tax=Trypanosoma equiperdum TaxID=5694 RepID=A0A1G4IC47_TRYEQ|nr:ER-golgi trafficking TRAPP I complex 85 kDa subunit, putative [Trypanosoma equiperdum]